MSDILREHLRATIKHLSMKRTMLLAEISEVDEVLKALCREEESLPRTTRMVFPVSRPEGDFSGMSIRWAILYYLAEHAKGAQTLGTIAEALKSGGTTTKAQSFNSNVSAVLSQMIAKTEVVKTDNEFKLSSFGESVWQSVKVSEKFLNRNNSLWAESEQQR